MHIDEFLSKRDRLSLATTEVDGIDGLAPQATVMADRIQRAMPQIRTALRGNRAPMVGTIIDSGAVNLLIVGGQDAQRTIKPRGTKGGTGT
jgi:hypothetical protein